jgi:hypothetical protein
MGGLRPIGSEKLEGMDKIRRIMEIARYNENIPTPVNENKRTDYTIELSDGNEYAIVKERQGYIIKRTISESVNDYIEPIQNRKYFSSYSEALKKLNLMAKDFNVTYGNEEGTSLFTEQKKKYKLKLPGKPKAEETPAPELPPPPAAVEPAPAPDMTATPPMGDEMSGELPPPPMDGEMGGDGSPPSDEMEPPMDDEMEPPMDDEMEPESDEDLGDDEGDKKGPSLKVIQKLTGKLAQKIRSYNTKDEMDSNDVKYIVNSILSAIDVDVLDDDDLEEIIDRLEGNYEDDEEGDDSDTEDEDLDMEEPPMFSDEDELPTPPEAPEGGEMKEYSSEELGETMSLGDAITSSIGQKFSGEVFEKLKGMDAVGGETTEDEYGMHGARKPRHTYGGTGEFKHLEHGTFGESEVDKIISQYFNVNEDEIIKEEKARIEKLEKLEKRRELNKKNVRNLSESVAQERGALKFVEKHPNYKLVGKTNKGNLVFKNGIVETKINLNGKPL